MHEEKATQEKHPLDAPVKRTAEAKGLHDNTDDSFDAMAVRVRRSIREGNEKIRNRWQ